MRLVAPFPAALFRAALPASVVNVATLECMQIGAGGVGPLFLYVAQALNGIEHIKNITAGVVTPGVAELDGAAAGVLAQKLYG